MVCVCALSCLPGWASENIAGAIAGQRVLHASAPAALPFGELIAEVAGDFQLEPSLLHAIAHTESAYNPAAISAKGAVGLMQVMPATGKRFGFERLNDPRVNLQAGASYLKWLLARFDNNLPIALAAYNAGEGAVDRYQGRIPPYPETRDYVTRVLARYQSNPRQLRVARMPDQAKPPTPAASNESVSLLTVMGRLGGALLASEKKRGGESTMDRGILKGTGRYAHGPNGAVPNYLSSVQSVNTKARRVGYLRSCAMAPCMTRQGMSIARPVWVPSSVNSAAFGMATPGSVPRACQRSAGVNGSRNCI
ncbi:lytic transglycosylase domain-containing protein [Chitinimonas arctica]|uniref:lytic transglycosylase domain-containing protein n=1 Tax=Chitinimonas arctica TaxID=2594795 RepID=UPI001CC82FFA|nr:lytic transglycosylase domain-containing protein [Chitinimonas arctica]